MATKWLSEQEDNLWRTFLEASALIRVTIESDLKTTAAMSLADYEVLVHLSEAEGHRLRMSELSELTVHSQSRLSQRVDRLGRRGWIVREPCPDDRRGTFAAITEAGLSVIRGAASEHVESVRRNFIDLVPEESVEDTAILLSKIVVALRGADSADSSK